MMSAGTIIGHRGAAGLAPENTEPALVAARDAGVRWVEVDLRHSADGVAVIFHDDDLSRCTDGRGAPERTTWAALSALDAGAWFHSRFRGTRLLRLERLLELLHALDLGVNLELKPGPHTDREQLVEIGCAAVQQQGPPPQGLVVSSFDERLLEGWRRRRPGDERAVLCDRPDAAALASAERMGTRILNVGLAALNAKVVARLVASGFEVNTWTCNRPARIQALWAAGLTGVFTDRPDRFLPRGGASP